MLDSLYHYLPHLLFILEGTIVTLQFSVTSVFFGMLLGIFLAICKVSNSSFIRFIAAGYTSVFRGTPLLVQISIIYFGLPGLVGIKFNVFTAGIIALSLNSGAYVSEIVRAGIMSVDNGQFEAAKALGIPPILRMKDIILPQALRNILPALVNELVNLIKESALVSTIGAMDLMKRAQLVSAETYNFFFPMLSAAAAYYVLVIIVTFIAIFTEKRLKL